MTTSEKSALKNRPISGLMMSSTSAVTMAVKAPPMTTPTAMSSTLPRMANALNSSKNFLMPLFFSSIDNLLLLVPFFTARGYFIFIIAYCAAICKSKVNRFMENKRVPLTRKNSRSGCCGNF